MHIYPLFKRLMRVSDELVEPNQANLLEAMSNDEASSGNENEDDDNHIQSVMFSRTYGKMYPIEIDYAHRPKSLHHVSLYLFKRYLVK